MKLSIGIIGLPNVGKSTLFQMLTKQEVNIANYPFATIDPNVGIVEVPDSRIDALAKVSQSQKKIYAAIEFYDIAGLVRGAYKGEGLGNQFLSHIRNVEALVQIVRCFPQNDIVHIEGSVDPLRDIEIIEMELIFKDLETVSKRMEKLISEVRGGSKQAKIDLEVLEKAKKILEEGKLLYPLKEEKIIKELQLLTAKPQILLFNGKKEYVDEKILEKINRDFGFKFLFFDLKNSNNLSPLIQLSYEILDLISFFTTGEDETRAWTIKKGTKAPEAAGVIHSDFEKGFIRAEVINWEKLIEAQGWNNAKQKGWIRLEGKEYIVKDGDVLLIRHN
jgi:ribosome-binding ATPase YchF (GTP1/OBG family)